MTDMSYDYSAQPARRVLILEDQALLALFLSDLLSSAGFAVCGPYSTVAPAMEAIDEAPPFAALLDVRLRCGETCEPVAEKLDGLGCQFAFATGFDGDRDAVIAKFPDVKRFKKPFENNALIGWLKDLD